MNEWRSHWKTKRAHSFLPSQGLSECGNAFGMDCKQLVFQTIFMSIVTSCGTTWIGCPVNACKTCIRVRRKQTRERMKRTAKAA
jgi:hypothetical protein